MCSSDLLSIKKALVIVGGDGHDELSADQPSVIKEITSSSIKESEFDPRNIFESTQAHQGGTALENAEVFKSIMENGDVDHAVSKLIAVNAGAAFYCSGKTDSIQEGIALSLSLIETGKVWQKYLQYKTLSHSIFQ